MSQPLDSFTVHRFRGLRDLELTGLGQVNLLVGGNDSGKTSVLEALALYCGPLDPPNWLNMSNLRAIRFGVRASQIRWLFPQDPDRKPEEDFTGEVVLTGEGTYSLRSIRAQTRQVRAIAMSNELPETPGVIPDAPDSPERIGRELRLTALTDDNTQQSCSFTFWESGSYVLPDKSGPTLPFQMIMPLDHWMQLFQLEKFSAALQGGLRDQVLSLLQALDDRITDLAILMLHGRADLYLKHSSAGYVPLDSYGDGIRRTLLYALAFPRIAGGVLLIDEVESAIHVSALGKVFRWMLDACKQYRVQLFITTHSLEALDAILAADTTPDEDIVGYRLARADGQTTAKRYGEGLLKRLRFERGLDVR